jgi:hypothetical protein
MRWSRAPLRLPRRGMGTAILPAVPNERVGALPACASHSVMLVFEVPRTGEAETLQRRGGSEVEAVEASGWRTTGECGPPRGLPPSVAFVLLDVALHPALLHDAVQDGRV